MKVFGVGVVQDEADVVAESVPWAARFCDRLVLWDLGSTDGTWEILQSLAGERIQVHRKPGLRYRSALRGEIAATLRPELSGEDWVYILDADEFVAGDPIPVLQAAREEGAHLVGAWQANFFPTPETLRELERMGEEAWARLPLVQRFRYYRLEWFEWRFVRMARELLWVTEGDYSRFLLEGGRPPRRSRRYVIVRHYRYRSPQQVRRRYAMRAAAREEGRFRYEVTGEFASLVRPAKELVRWPEDQAELVVPRSELVRARLRLLWWRLLRRRQRRKEQRSGGA